MPQSAKPASAASDTSNDITHAIKAINDGQYQDAVDACRKIVEVTPEDARPYFLLGVISNSINDPGEAVSFFEKAHLLDPDCLDYVNALACQLAKIGKLTDGLYYAKLALALDANPIFESLALPGLDNYFTAMDDAEEVTFLADALTAEKEGRLADAHDLCTREAKVTSNNPEVYELNGRLLSKMAEYNKAIASFHSALHYAPEWPEAYKNLAATLYQSGKYEEGRACHQEACRLSGDALDTQIAALADLTYHDGGDWLLCKDAIAKLQETLAGGKDDFDLDVSSEVGDRTLKIGYLTNDLDNAAVFNLLDLLVRHHSQKACKVFIYQTSNIVHANIKTLETKCKNWRNLAGMDIAAAGFEVEMDNLDILVDASLVPNALSAGLLSKQFATVQVGWLNKVAAAASPAATHYLSDKATQDNDAVFATGDMEQVILDQGLLALDGEGRVEAAGYNNILTFGVTFDLARLSSSTVSAHARILKSLPGSRLYLGNVDRLTGSMQNRAVDLYAHFGVSDRVFFQEIPDEDPQLAEISNDFYYGIDIFLDTFPVSGGIELAQALAAGAQTATIAGDRRAGLTGASVLSAAGKDDCIAKNTDEYVDIIERLAEGITAGKLDRKEAQKQALASPLFDTKGFIQSLEASYRKALSIG